MIEYFHREQNDNTVWVSHGHEIYNQFCNLLVKHYRESREVTFYANKLHLTPKHFSRYFKRGTGMSPRLFREHDAPR